MYNCRSYDVSDLPGLNQQRRQVTSILLLNGQEEWFRQQYGINLSGSVTTAWLMIQQESLLEPSLNPPHDTEHGNKTTCITV
jgi:phytoene dehydrogenase-like protein